MKRDELELEKQCRETARRHGWVALKLEKNGNKGVPDDLFLHPDGRVRLVEFKKDDRQRLRPEQAVWLARFGKIATVCHDFDTFCKWLEIDVTSGILEK